MQSLKKMSKGRLEKGMLVDLAVLSQDIFSIPPDKLPGTKSVLTNDRRKDSVQRIIGSGLKTND